MNDIVKIAYEAYKFGKSGNYSEADTMDVLRKELIEANGGSTKLNFKAMRDGKCIGLFAIVEEIISRIIVDELKGNEFFMNFVDYKNLALGDMNEFWTPNNSLFVVSDTAEGTHGIRRQRLNVGQKITVPTVLKTIKIYDELNRVLAGRIDFNEFISLVATSFKKKAFNDIYSAWNSVTAATIGATYYPTAGSYDEEKLIDLIAHVEAATDKVATIVCTKKAARKLKPDVIADSAKEDLYDMGYYGKFNGTSIVTMKQVHIDNTDNFLLDDNKIYIVVSDMKPIKFVTEGDSLLLMGDPMSNADMTQEFFYGERYGVAVVVVDKFGVYEIA